MREMPSIVPGAPEDTYLVINNYGQLGPAFAETDPDRANFETMRHSLINRMGPCSRTPSGPAVSTDCINRPDRRLHPTNATASIYLLQRGSHPQRTSSGCLGMSELFHQRKSGLLRTVVRWIRPEEV